jgi:ribosome-associated translation inhibitor RaiA
MQIIFNTQKISISDRFKQRIETKFEQGLGKLLQHYKEEMKIGHLSIEKVSRSGYEIKFDMNLPACPINIKDTHKVLLDGVMRVRDQAKRQVKKHLEKLRDY